MAKRKTGTEPAVRKVRVQIEPASDTPIYYCNYFEIASTQHDFVLSGIRVPAKFPAAKMAGLDKNPV